MVKINIEVIGEESEIHEFVQLCAKLELSGTWGANVTIPVNIDGDGSGRLCFNALTQTQDRGIVDIVKYARENLKKSFKLEVDSDSIETHYIGE